MQHGVHGKTCLTFHPITTRENWMTIQLLTYFITFIIFGFPARAISTTIGGNKYSPPVSFLIMPAGWTVGMIDIPIRFYIVVQYYIVKAIFQSIYVYCILNIVCAFGTLKCVQVGRFQRQCKSLILYETIVMTWHFLFWLLLKIDSSLKLDGKDL